MIKDFTYLRLFIVAFVMASLLMTAHAQCNVESNVTTTDNFCAPEDSVYISLEPSGGTAPYSYIWSTGATTQTISVLLVPSDIYFTITDAVGCTHVNFVHIKAGPYIAGIGGNYFLCGNSTATLNLFWYRIPPDNVEYLWSTGATTPTIDITSAGTYSVTVTDPFNGCTATFSTSVDPPSPEIEVVSITPASCGQNNGAINITASGEYSPFTYTWSNGAASEDLNNIGAGTYTVTVTASDGCTSTLNATVTGNSNLTISGITSPNTSCISNNGSIDITPAPSGSYSYTWSNGSSTQDLNGIASGNYTVTVTASSGCSATANFTVANNQNNPAASTSTTQATCGQNNGSVNLNVSGGTQPIEYEWSNGSSSQDLLNVGPGTYTVTVTDDNGCTVSASGTVLNDNQSIAITGSALPNISCEIENGSINISVAPFGSYEFDWSNGAITEDISNLVDGIYFVTVTSGEGCSEIASFTVVDNQNTPVITSTSIPASCGQDNGSINVSISNGTAPFSFAWSNGSSDEDLINISAGTYTVTVTDDNGCTSTLSAVVSNSNSTITINSSTVPNTLCNGSNGSIDLTLPSGVYSFVWSNNLFTEDLNGLAAGIYSVTVTDDSGCSSGASFEIFDQLEIQSTTSVTTPATCGQSSGSIDITVSGGTAPFNYVWSNGSYTEDLINIDAGNYALTITDANGCSTTHNATVSNNNQTMNITGVTSPNSSCTNRNGRIDLTVTPAGTYGYTWSDGTVVEDIGSLAAGNYSVTVTDPEGCSSFATFMVDDQLNSPSLTGYSTPGSCANGGGKIDISISGGTTPIIILWSNGSTSEDLSGISAGNYNVSITDANGCTATSSFSVLGDSTALEVIGVVTNNTSCDQLNGAIDITVTPAGFYSFNWSNGSTTEDLVNLPGGEYIVTVSDNSGCSEIATFIVDNATNGFSLSGISTPNTSCTTPNGSIDLTIIPAGAYSIQWSTGQTTEDIYFLDEGTYRVIVTNGNNCSTSALFEITAETIDVVITGSITPATCGLSNGSIELTVTPLDSVNFLWSTGDTIQNLFGLASGNYSVTVTDENNCTAEADFVVSGSGNSFSVFGITTDNQSCISPDGSISLEILPEGAYTYNWSNGSNEPFIDNLSAGFYEVTVTDEFQCSVTDSFEIVDMSSEPIVMETITDETCEAMNGAIQLTVTPSAGNTFVWSTGHASSSLQNVAAGIYSVTVTAAGGCVAIYEYEVSGSEAVEIDLDVDLTGIEVNGTVHSSVTVNLPIDAIEKIVWSPDENIVCHSHLCMEQVFNIDAPTEIMVMVTDTNGCTDQESMLLEFEIDPKVYIPNVFSPGTGGQNERFTLFANENVEEVVLLEIFNRWGDLLFFNRAFPPNDPSLGWNGEYQGKLMNPDVFAYRAVVRFRDGEVRTYRGDVTLIK